MIRSRHHPRDPLPGSTDDAAAPPAPDDTAGGLGPRVSAGAGLLLLAGNGSADAYIYLERGHVFAEAMTGNLVLFAVGLSAPRLIAFWRPLTVFTAFSVGLILATRQVRLARRPTWSPKPVVLVVLALQALSFAAVAALPATFPQLIITGVVGGLAGLQLAAVRRIDAIKVTTIVMTSNVLRAVEAVFDEQAVDGPEVRRRAAVAVGAPAAFVVGALIGGALSELLHVRAALFTALVFATVFTLSARTWRREHRGAEP